ncbi:hypothetical protein TRFO_39456 [Tritrichomonas foetus]|uniref:Ubiquitin-like domain-containing protein n=1 Tax=Tritrichomonas foetus TaxID=1144522 RepID=A0A1J4J9P4_9EUKA|nr:hypothetical protein TRFO_39456 [Tritrichomonas foetus]|eukprot:OHS94371.1 hypothetical protein TRFO_39456 [Tritrichomonas foetus]
MENIRVGIAQAAQLPSFIEIHNSSTILDALAIAGFKEAPGTDLLAIHRGRTLNLFVSLHAHGIKNNDRIFILQRRRKDGSRKKQFLESLSQRAPSVIEIMNRKRMKLNTEKKAEYYRILDLMYNSWENYKTFPKMLEDLLKGQEMHHTNNSSNTKQIGTNLDFMSEISEEPLPSLGFVQSNGRNVSTCGIAND